MSGTCEAKYVIVRCYGAGVHAGYLAKHKGQTVSLINARRLWKWSGAAELSQLSQEGVKKPDECRFSVAVPEIMLLDAIEIIPCSAAGQESIKAVNEWRA